MNKELRKVCGYFILGIAVQAGIYFYLDRVLFAPTASYNVSSLTDSSSSSGTSSEGKAAFKDVKIKGKAHYSHDYQYMADVTSDSITIYNANDVGNPQDVDLKGKGVSYFEWLPDRNLALIGMYPADWQGGTWDITLARYNPSGSTESDAPIENLPRNSKIVDVAYSTATNAVYLKVEVDDGLYRIYRTDANYDTRRIYVQTSDIGKIAVFYDEDRLLYDDTERGIIYLFNGDDSSWRIISPPGMYRLVGLGDDKTIYAVKINDDGDATAYYTGKLGVGFDLVKKLESPVDFDTVTIHLIQEAAKSANVSSDNSSDSSDSSSDSSSNQ